MSSSGELQNGTGAEDQDSDPELELYLRDRRRAKSLPAYPERASLLQHLSHTCRKRVKFADALGLSLFSVKHFSAAEEPDIPSKVLSDLCTDLTTTRLSAGDRYIPGSDLQLSPGDRHSPSSDPRLSAADRYTASSDPRLSPGDRYTAGSDPRLSSGDRYTPGFDLQLSPGDTTVRVGRCRVALEAVYSNRSDIYGFIRVAPGHSGEAEVGVRFTFNGWSSFCDAPAVPAPGQHRLAFTLHAPPGLGGNPLNVHFAVYLRSEQGEFWDNNDGQNYTVQCSSML